MFRKNKKEDARQGELSFFLQDRVNKFFNRIKGTEEDAFYEIIFKNINEDIFRDLYCQDNGRPNAPINSMVCALIYREKKNFSYSELFKQIDFNLAVRRALGIFEFAETPFNEATLFNFLRKVNAYSEEHNVNLFERVFDELTQHQLKSLKLKTNIARTDSIMINSNIKKYGRLQLLIEVILRLYRVLDPTEQKEFDKEFGSYSKMTSEKYIYRLKNSDLSKEFVRISQAYYWFWLNVSESPQNMNEYKNFKRVFEEHFKITDEQLELKESREVSSSSLQSPDDPEATYRQKKGEKYRGYVASVTETANPDNDINLVVDVSVEKNNVDDSKIMEKRVDKISQKLDNLEGIHYDGGYGNDEVSGKFKENGVTTYQTAIKGRKSSVNIEIEKTETGYNVKCPYLQEKRAEKTRTRYKACFNSEICSQCPFAKECPTQQQKRENVRVYYFDEGDYERNRRFRAIEELPKELRKIRNNVEATMNEYSCRLKGHKLKVRSYFRASLFAIMTSMAINFGRIYRFFNFSSFLGTMFHKFCFIEKKYSFKREFYVINSILSFFTKNQSKLIILKYEFL